MTPARRRMLLIVLLAATIAFIVFDRRAPQNPAVVDAVAPRSGAKAQDHATAGAQRDGAGESMILPIRPREAAGNIDDAFAPRDWRPPPPPPPPQPVRQAVVAPPLPYTVIGKQLEDGVWHVFLRADARILVVKSLDTIDDAYRVEEIRPPVMTLTHLPTQQRLSVTIGGGE